jgi:hypothetical protein
MATDGFRNYTQSLAAVEVLSDDDKSNFIEFDWLDKSKQLFVSVIDLSLSNCLER